ncbi:MAG: ATP-dependent protease, partial [Marinomonas atlantica]|nr:ATP-dependent protease [Marinomonas atlantica]
EGFFNVCSARGLTGTQGVIIPKSNVVNLMLSDEVIEAVEAGKFHVYAIENADEALHLLTGIEPGVQDSEGNYPEGTLSNMVLNRLEEISKLGHEDDEESEEDSDKEKKKADKSEDAKQS